MNNNHHFDRANYSYRSLPINNQTKSRVLQAPTSYALATNTNNSNSIKKFENSEEFARLDELLADLLSEVEQPILLNKNGSIVNWKLTGDTEQEQEQETPRVSTKPSRVPQMGTHSFVHHHHHHHHDRPPLSPRRPNTSLAMMIQDNDDQDDRLSIKSGLSTTSTILKSKYHTVSNNFVEQTKPQPTLSHSSSYSLKRAVSAPPTEPGKILLQRMELKSPLTVRYPAVDHSSHTQSQINTLRPSTAASTLNNKYNNRGILKTNTLQPQPQRVYTRATSERPNRGQYTNGYDTDTCLANNNFNQNSSRLTNDSDGDSISVRLPSFRTTTTNDNRHDASGYETDSGTHRRKLPLQPPTVLNHANTFHHKSQPQQQQQQQQQQIPNKCYDSFTLQSHESQQQQQQQQQPPSAFQTIKETNSSRGTPTLVSKSTLTSQQSQQTSTQPSTQTQTQEIYNKFITNRQDARSPSVSSINEVFDINGSSSKLVKNNQSYWYKPKISREEAINLLKDKPFGAFIIRDSNNFPGSFGLALKVDKLPPNVPIKPNADQNVELVRHFLIEPTNKGVRIKGCCNEPIFGSLAALVYQHSITPLALPCKLVLPVKDLIVDAAPTEVKQLQQQQSNAPTPTPSNSKSSKHYQVSDPNYTRQLLDKGAACNVYYLNSINVGSLQGSQAISKALSSTKAYDEKDPSQLLLVQFKVNSQGIFVSDLSKKRFARKQFPTNTIMFAGIEEKRHWPLRIDKISSPKIFGIVNKPKVTSGDSECHLFIEIDQEQPAIAIIDFINRYLIPSKTHQSSNKMK